MQNTSPNISAFQMSPHQKYVWSRADDHRSSNVWCAVRLPAGTAVEALQSAGKSLVERHEILRTVFQKLAGLNHPFQVVRDTGRMDWHEADLGENSESDWCESEGMRPFDLENGPLLRLSLLHSSGGEPVLVLAVPAVSADRESVRILLRQLLGSPDTGLVAPLQYADFAEWANELTAVETEDSKEGLNFWSAQGVQTLAAPELFVNGSAPESQRQTPLRPSVLPVNLSSNDYQQISTLSEALKVSVETVCLSLFQVLLTRLSKDTSFVVYRTSGGRNIEGLDEAVGPFSRLVPMATHSDLQAPIELLIRQCQDHVLATDAWLSYLPWPETSKNPVRICFDFLAEAEGDQRRVEINTPALPQTLTLEYHWNNDSKETVFRFDHDYFDAAEVARLAEYMVAFTHAVLGKTTAPAGAVEIPDEIGWSLLAGINATHSLTRKEETLDQWFEATAARMAGSPALIFENRSLSYGELNQAANRIARYLRRKGVVAGTRVALCCERSAEMILGVMGILKAGGAYVPLQPDLPKARLAYQLEATGAFVVLTQTNLVEKLPAFDGDIVCLDGHNAALEAESGDNPGSISKPSDPCYVIYTSGSTGQPKGVVVRHENVTNYCSHIASMLDLNLEHGLRFATVSTISADLGNTCIFPALLSGGSLEVRSYESSIDGNLFADLNAKSPVDVLKITPSNLRALLESGRGAEILPRKVLILGGEAFPLRLRDEVMKLSTCRIFNHYGPTETTIGSLTYPASKLVGKLQRSATVPIGRPIKNTEIYVLDSFRNRVPMGVAGELCIGGAGVSSGYLNDPEQTRERFIANTYGSGAAPLLYRTGDLVRLHPSGDVEYLGRIDEQVKIRGYRVEPAEIERVLSACPGVRDAVVLVRASGNDDLSLTAYVVPSGAAFDASILRSALLDRLPEYMVPSVFLRLEAMPLNRNGKIDRRALPDPKSVATENEKTVVGPRNPIEERILEIWIEVLKVSQISIDDSFFELGGHSLMATQVIARVRTALDVQVPVRTLFERPTLAGFSDAVMDSLGAVENDPELSALLAEVEGLSDEEANRLLQAEIRRN